jgi:hypothetical protein
VSAMDIQGYLNNIETGGAPDVVFYPACAR